MATNFRYWRVIFQESIIGPSSDTYVGGLALRAVAGGPNLALINPTTRGLDDSSYPVANLFDTSSASTYRSEVGGWVTFEMQSPADIVQVAVTASSQWQAFGPKRLKLLGGWTRDAFLHVEDISFTGSWGAGQTKTFAIPPYAYDTDIEWVERAVTQVAMEAMGDEQIVVAKGTAYGVADFENFSLSKTLAYGLTDNQFNGLAKALVYVVMEEAPLKGHVDGFRMRNAVGRNVVMRGGKGEPPPPPPVHYPPGEIPPSDTPL